MRRIIHEIASPWKCKRRTYRESFWLLEVTRNTSHVLNSTTTRSNILDSNIRIPRLIVGVALPRFPDSYVPFEVYIERALQVRLTLTVHHGFIGKKGSQRFHEYRY